MKIECYGNNHRSKLCYHIDKHCEDKNEMLRESYFVLYELPNEHTMVGHLIKSITCKEKGIIYSITHIQGCVDHMDDF